MSPHAKLLALLHDATECYIGDMQSGIKDRLSIDINGEMIPVREWEATILVKICRKFGCDARLSYWTAVDVCDKVVTGWEMSHFFGDNPDEMFAQKPDSWQRMRFVELFNHLIAEIKGLK